MHRAGKFLLHSLVLLSLWVVWTFHRGTAIPPREITKSKSAFSSFTPKEELGIHQLVVGGEAYDRGFQAGSATKDLIQRQESILVSHLKKVLKNPVFLQAFNLFAMTWFKGIEDYFEPWMLEEIYGVSQATSKEFDELADRFTRQVAYHGIHEVGQLFVDSSGSDRGCTAFALPVGGSWVFGRNFDFEGGRIFDDEKIMKWVFPEQGIPYVSVVWAGMVGAVTAVNANGVLISMNAAGSTDFRRHGTPSTLVLLKALQFGANGEAAVEILKQATVFIADIYMVVDGPGGKVYRVEKSPKSTDVIEVKGPTAVANYLASPIWEKDSTNLHRRFNLTSEARTKRGEDLVNGAKITDSASARLKIMEFLRDKSSVDGRPLPLGHRSAIDPLIASHSVIYDGAKAELFVNEGPGASGRYLGFDLKASFASRSPVRTVELPKDDIVSQTVFLAVRDGEKKATTARSLAKNRKCAEAATLLEEVTPHFHNHYFYHWAKAETARCFGQAEDAIVLYKLALEGRPAFVQESEEIKARISNEKHN